MWCPNCNSEKTRVIGTDKTYIVERFRRCDDCGYSFPTIESHRFDPNWQANTEYSEEEIKHVLQKRHPKNRDLLDD